MWQFYTYEKGGRHYAAAEWGPTPGSNEEPGFAARPFDSADEAEKYLSAVRTADNPWAALQGRPGEFGEPEFPDAD